VILVLQSGLDGAACSRLSELVESCGLRPRLLDGEVEGGRRLMAVERRGGQPDPDLVARAKLWPGVERVLDFEAAFPLCREAPSRVALPARHGARELSIGPDTLVWIAGPCSVESPDVLGETAAAVAQAGASMLRGGAYKPRTSPYSFQGSGREGLLLLEAVARDVGLPLVSEVLDPRDVEFVAQHVDMLQVGSRSMQNFPLLREAGAAGRPVLLKRGGAATLAEFLAAAEYVLAAGCRALVLCERGVKGFDPSRRNLLDLAVVPAIKERTGLPVIVDPSHATGQRRYVIPMAKAAVAAGADGVMTEVHSRPEQSRSDGSQALVPSDLETLGPALRTLATLEGRSVPVGPCFRPAAVPASKAAELRSCDGWARPGTTAGADEESSRIR
jgi:3-deoxy-7-phosphoheptulonate synthase